MNDLRTAFCEKYPKYERIIDLFGEANDCEPTWENLTKVRLAKFVDFLGENMAASSVKTYCAMLKSVLTLYCDEVNLPSGYAKILSPKGCVSQNVYLTEDEILRLYNVRCSTDTETEVRNGFILGCLTGARHSDYIRFTEANKSGENLVYVSQKTHIKAEVPLSPIAAEIISLNRGKNVCTSTFNRTIRDLCRRAGIDETVKLFKGGCEVEGEKWEFVSSHTARRSFATNVYLRCRDIFLVSRLLGHSSVEMTARYICATEIPEELREYFLNFQNSEFSKI